MSVHEQFAEDLALYAVGALDGEERTTVEKHLEGCADCRRELEQLRADSALLALSVSGPMPPQRSRQRLMAAIAREEKMPTLIPVKRRFAWWGVAGWAAAAAMLVIAVLLLRSNDSLMQQIASLKNQSAQQQAMLQQAKEVVETFTAGDASHVTLVAANTPPQPQGKAIYLQRRSSLIFLANNLPALPPQRAYELWLIPMTGAPIPAGVFKPDAHGSATVVNPPLPAGVEAKAFAITVEPEAGSLAPTSTPIMLGAGE
jgi:anti-sigma-K factor RskA